MKLSWDDTGKRFYETGVKNAVLYPQNSQGAYDAGVAWNGLTGFTQSPSGAEASAYWADDIKYLNLMSNEDFGATIAAYTYPDEFKVCDGSASLAKGVTIGQQKRMPFGFSCRTALGNDIEGYDYGYKIHLVYGALASPSERNYTSVNESPEPIELSWEISTTPVNVTGHKPTAHLEIDSTMVDADKLAAFEAILYGSAEAEPRLPLPDEVAQLFADTAAGGDDDDDGEDPQG